MFLERSGWGTLVQQLVFLERLRWMVQQLVFLERLWYRSLVQQLVFLEELWWMVQQFRLWRKVID